MIAIRVVARVERSKKGKRIRVRALCDGRAVQAVDAGSHWRIA